PPPPRRGEAPRAELPVDSRGSRDRLLPSAPLAGGRGRVPGPGRALAGRRLRALRARPVARESGPPEGGGAAHQACQVASSAPVRSESGSQLAAGSTPF